MLYKIIIDHIRILIFTLSLFSGLLSLDNEYWMKDYGGNGMDELYNLEITKTGDYLFVGSTESKGNGVKSRYNYKGQIIDCPTPRDNFWIDGSTDIWLLKLDKYGNEIWETTYGSDLNEEAYSVIELSCGNYLILGAKHNLDSNYDIFVVKVDSYGNEIWNRTYGGILDDKAYHINELIDGNYAIIGSTKSYGNGESDMWFIKIDQDGKELYNRTFGSSLDDFGYFFIEKSNGDFLITGSHTILKDRTYKDKVFTDKKMYSWILSTNSKGEILWENKSNRGIGQFIKKTKSGNYLIRETLSSQGMPNKHLNLRLIDKAGETIWESFLEDVNGIFGGNTIEESPDDGFYIISYTYGYIDLTDFGDIKLIKTDTKGKKLWEKIYNGQSLGIDRGNSIKLTKDNKLIICGYTNVNGEKVLIELDNNDKEYKSSHQGSLNEIITPLIKNSWIIKTDLNGDIN